MDLSFARRLDRAPGRARLSYPRLIAIIAADQAGSPTARAEARIDRGEAGTAPLEALIELLDPRGRWIAAAAALSGSFCPTVAGRLQRSNYGNASSTNMTAAFTLAG